MKYYFLYIKIDITINDLQDEHNGFKAVKAFK